MTNEHSINKKFNRVIRYFLYKSVLDLVYFFWINPIYGYTGFNMEFAFSKYIISMFLLLILVFFTPIYKSRISELIFQLHLIIMIIPLLTIYTFNNVSILFLLAMIIMFIFQILSVKLIPLIKIKTVKRAKLIVWITILSMTIISYLFLIYTQNLNIRALNLISVYEFRKDRVIQPLIMNYILTWQFRIINPIILVYSLKKNNKILFIVISILQLVFFLYYPNKEILFSFGLIFFAFFILNKKLVFEKTFIYFIFGITVFTLIVYRFFGQLVLFANFVWRLLYVPAIIKFWHYDFFSVNEKLYYSEGIIGRIFNIQSPYLLSSGFLTGQTSGNANTGYIAYGFDNAGFFGMIIISIVLILVLYFVDSITHKTNHKIVFPLLVYPMLTLNDTDLLTLLLTGGFFIFIIFAIFDNQFFGEYMSKDKKYEDI